MKILVPEFLICENWVRLSIVIQFLTEFAYVDFTNDVVC